MSEPFLLVAGRPGMSGALCVPASGGWTLEVELDAADVPTGIVDVTLAGATLRGTVDDAHSGAYGERRKVRVVGGGGWTKVVKLTHYRNDGPSGIVLSVLLADLAAAAGETVELDPAADRRLGTDWVPPEWPAADIMRAAGVTSWWVGLDGVTRFGARPTVDAGEHEVLDFDPAEKVAKVSVDRLDAVGPGSRLQGPLFEQPFVVRDVEATVGGGSFVLTCWGDYEARATATAWERFTRLLYAFVRAFTRRYDFHGLYRYRVLSQTGDRLNLQPVSRKPLPDIRSVAIAPGMPGIRVAVAAGSSVLVAFVDGDPAQPVVTHFWRVGEPGWLSTDVLLGGAGGRVIREGDLLNFPPPGVGAVTFAPAYVTDGDPGVGWSRVKA